MSKLDDRSTRRDRFHQKAKKQGFLARAVFKLEEIDKQFKIFKPGQRVLDLGCAPGSWLQYARTVLPNRTADVDFYRAAVTAGPGLAAFFPADDCLGPTLTNVVDLSRNGQLEGIVTYDGRTNRAFGQRAVSFNAGGDVQIPNNPAFEFSGGNGTVEAIIYMDGTAFQDETIFAWAWDGSTSGYALQASADGSQLIYLNDSPVTLTWPAPVSLIGRRAHLALVIDNTTNVTAILDGQSLGTKVQPGFGAAGGAPAWIGALGTSLVKPFKGTIDELSVYGTNLSVNTIQVHYSRFLYGTNFSAPSIVSQPGSRSVLAYSARKSPSAPSSSGSIASAERSSR